ncbi:hypothetical protein RvY_15354 [Ramazzottius varieornatus]|uniref:Uncharacterized protein n=1 Tax=Ramazzottius varieornatus TaxID=947166 RepID=A0A1D1W1G7_RAMVA|nr:hypothetical protein RvY_15354 [Ramazzottius varieornatus]
MRALRLGGVSVAVKDMLRRAGFLKITGNFGPQATAARRTKRLLSKIGEKFGVITSIHSSGSSSSSLKLGFGSEIRKRPKAKQTRNGSRTIVQYA